MSRFPFGLATVVWNAAVAAALALASCLLLLGRALPTQATLGWALMLLLFFVAGTAWLTVFSARLGERVRGGPGALPTTLLAVEGPLFALAAVGSIAIYLSDRVNHQVTYFLQPTPAVVLVLVVLATAVAQEAALRRTSRGWWDGARLAVADCGRWALPASLLLLGLLQGASQLWIIGNDFTRYWAITDAINSLAGYPASINQPSYLEGGMYRYSIEMPVFPLLLLASFKALGHNTLAAHTPALLANTVLPLLLYGFYRKAGLERPLAFAAAAAVALFPFLRLYTLNSPYPDAIFVALLVGTGYLFLNLIPHSALSTRDSALRDWAAFGLLGGVTTVARPEGLLFVGIMFVALLPNLLKLRLYLAGVLFLAPVVPFFLVMISTFGIPWPRNAGTSFGLENIAGNLDWMGRMSLRWYADAFGLSTSGFVLLVWVLVVAWAAGTVWIARKSWQMALLPAAAGLHAVMVFAIDPRVSGVDQWFDFFRHLSYGLPFAALALFWVGDRGWGLGARRVFRSLIPNPQPLTPNPRVAVALLVLLLSGYELFLLSRPSQTYGAGAGQLLTSDVWVTFPDLIAHRYSLPQLPFVHQEGVLMIDPSFEYISSHLERVRAFFEPYSTINTGLGDQYEVSSLLALLFGAVFAFSAANRSARPG